MIDDVIFDESFLNPAKRRHQRGRGFFEPAFVWRWEWSDRSFWEPSPTSGQAGRRDQANGFKDKTVATRVGRLEAEDPPGKALVILPEVVGARLTLGEGLKAGHCRDVRQGSLHSQGEPDHGATVWDRDLGQPGLDRESPRCWMESWSSSGNGSWGRTGWSAWNAHYEKVRVNIVWVRDLAILKAIGVNGWGKREVLGVSVAQGTEASSGATQHHLGWPPAEP